MVFEHMEMSLSDFISTLNENESKISGFYIKKIFKQIVKGVDHMHRNLVMHRDLKSSNILISLRSGLVKVADLGLARHFNLPFGKYDNQIGKFCLFLLKIEVFYLKDFFFNIFQF